MVLQPASTEIPKRKTRRVSTDIRYQLVRKAKHRSSASDNVPWQSPPTNSFQLQINKPPNNISRKARPDDNPEGTASTTNDGVAAKRPNEDETSLRGTTRTGMCDTSDNEESSHEDTVRSPRVAKSQIVQYQKKQKRRRK